MKFIVDIEFTEKKKVREEEKNLTTVLRKNYKGCEVEVKRATKARLIKAAK